MVLEFMKPLGELLLYRDKINKELEEIHPRNVNTEYLSFVSGKVTYTDLSKDIEDGLMLPNWDMLDRPKCHLRPMVFLLLMGGLDKNPDDFVKYSAILEMIHNGTLIHDDIEDGGKIRRGDLSTYLKYGTDVAVNSANLMYFAPFLFLKKYKKDFSGDVIVKSYDCLMEHLNRVTWGQAIDIKWHNELKVPSVEEYLQMCCYKTGAIDRMVFSFAGVLAEVDDSLQEKLEDFGESLGICFQIHDDFLDICSIDRKNVGGKTVGNDISEGKKSIVNILALDNLESSDREKLLSILNKKTEDSSEIQEALELIGSSGSLEETLKLANREFGKLKESCGEIINDKYASILVELLEAMEKDMIKKYSNTQWAK